MELAEEGGARKRRQNADRRAVEAHTGGFDERLLEGSLVVPAESKDDARLHEDPLPMDSRYPLGVGLDGNTPTASCEEFLAERTGIGWLSCLMCS
jgi:hypothetical protein